MSSKYDPLYKHLKKVPGDVHEVTITFADLEAMLGLELPPSAHDHDAWWGSDPKHVQAKAWLDAGFTASPKRGTKRVSFRRAACQE